MGKAIPGERRGSDQSLDGKSLYSQTLCCVLGEYVSFLSQTKTGKPN